MNSSRVKLKMKGPEDTSRKNVCYKDEERGQLIIVGRLFTHETIHEKLSICLFICKI